MRIPWLLALSLAAAAVGCKSTQYRFAADAKPLADNAKAVVPAAFEEGTEPEIEQVQAETLESLPEVESVEVAPIATEAPDAEPVPPPPTTGAAAPTLDDVVRSVVEFFPMIREAAAARGIAYGQVLEASGAFDHKFELDYNSQPLDFYENHWGKAGIKRDTTWGGQTFAGYKIGRGVFEPWFLERESNKGGEFSAGFMAPLVRDRVIDTNRAALWQAQAERARVEAIIDLALIQAARDGAVAYWEWIAAAENLAIAQSVLKLATDRQGFLEATLAEGATKRIDLTDNRRIIVSRRAKVVDSRRKLQQTAAKLSLFLRDPTGRPVVVTDERPNAGFAEVGDVDGALAESDIVFAQSNRPEPRELDVIGRQLGIAIRQASNETWPDIDAGLLVAQDVGERTSSKGDKSEFELEARLTVSVPLERRKAFGKLRQLQGKLTQVRIKRGFVQDKITIDVQIARAALTAAAQRVEQTTEGLELARAMTAAENDLFREGQSSLFNLNIREKQEADAAVERVFALLDYHLAVADYAAALGLSQPEIDGGTPPIAPPEALEPDAIAPVEAL